MKNSLFLFAIATSISLGAAAQSTDDKSAAFKTLVDSQNYVFQAQTAMPLRGGTRQLTTYYDLKVTKKAIVCDLPYYGRAYVAPINPSQNGLQFTSRDFTYTTTPRKNGGWDVVIKPKDYRDVQQMTLTISTAGYTTLQVTNLNKDPISFNGVIVAPSSKKK
jgi:hypothetical protein